MITLYSSKLTKDHRCKMVKRRSYEYAVETFLHSYQIADMMRSIFMIDQKTEEYLYAIYLGMQCHILGVVEISHGTVNQTMVCEREIFMKGFLLNAIGVIIVHNHLGAPVPSKEDIGVYHKLKKAGELVEMQVNDFIIIAGDLHFSFYEEKKGGTNDG